MLSRIKGQNPLKCPTSLITQAFRPVFIAPRTCEFSQIQTDFYVIEVALQVAIIINLSKNPPLLLACLLYATGYNSPTVKDILSFCAIHPTYKDIESGLIITLNKESLSAVVGGVS